MFWQTLDLRMLLHSSMLCRWFYDVIRLLQCFSTIKSLSHGEGIYMEGSSFFGAWKGKVSGGNPHRPWRSHTEADSTGKLHAVLWQQLLHSCCLSFEFEMPAWAERRQAVSRVWGWKHLEMRRQRADRVPLTLSHHAVQQRTLRRNRRFLSTSAVGRPSVHRSARLNIHAPSLPHRVRSEPRWRGTGGEADRTLWLSQTPKSVR